jgi:tetratricopeptide (TPR) repeat protein
MLPICSFSQTTDQQLAQYYYSNEQYDKALGYYEKFYDKDVSKFNLNRYVDCLIQTGNDKSAEKILKKAVDSKKENQEYSIALGSFYEERNEGEKASKIYERLISELKPNPGRIISLYNAFKAKAKGSLSLETLVQGRKLLKKELPIEFSVC